MYYERGKGEPPKRSRKSESAFESTKEWRKMKADIDKRDFVPNEYVLIALDDDRKEQIGIQARRTIARFIKKYLRDNGLDKYTVKSFRRDDKDFFIVRYTPVVRGVA